jgi:tetratricopeptide (TPR) repeat protein
MRAKSAVLALLLISLTKPATAEHIDVETKTLYGWCRPYEVGSSESIGSLCEGYIDPGNARTYGSSENAYADLGEYRWAIEDYDEALLINSSLAVAYYNRGTAYYHLGEYRRAIENYDQVLRIDPGYALAYFSRGNGYRALGEHARAIEDYDQALRLNPGDAYAYYNRGLGYDDLGEHRRAIEDYDQALRLDPGDADAYNSRGIAYKRLAEYERAVGDWEKALQLDGATRVKRWQKFLKGKDHYSGAIDGVYGPAMRRALLACARDPEC